MGGSGRGVDQGITGGKSRRVVSYAAAVLAVSVSLGMRYVLALALGPDLPVFLFFCPAVIVVAFLAGTGPGLTATAAGVLESAFWVYPPGSLSVEQVTNLLLFGAVGIIASVFAGMYRRAKRRTVSEREESALTTGEARFSTVFHSSPVSMSLVRMSDGLCQDVNQAHIELFGFSRDETVGHAGQELNMWVNPDDRKKVLEILSRQQRVSNYEVALRRKQGDTVTTLLSAEVIRLGGEPFLWIMHSDLTERTRTEEKFRLVVETAPTGLVIVNRRGRIVLVNAQAEKQFGYSRSDLIGESIETLVPGRERSKHEENRREYFVDPRSRIMGKGRDLLGVRRDGTEFPVEVGLTPMEMTDGLHVMASIIDITERKRAEDALRRSEARLKKVLEVETVGVMFWDLATGCLVDANDTFLALMGYSRRDVEGRTLTWQKLTPPEYMELSRAEVRKFMATGRLGPYEKEYLRRDGTRRWLVFAGSSLGGDSCVEFCVDISARKKAEAALLESEESLRLVFEGMREAFAVQDVVTDGAGRPVDLRFLRVNAAAERQLGKTQEELVGHLQSAIRGPLRSEDAEVIGRVLRTQEPVSFERHDPRRGSWSAVTMHSPRPGQVATLSRDITDIKEADIALRTLVDAIPGMVLLTDTKGTVLAVNETLSRRLGMSPGQMIGRDAYEGLPPGLANTRKKYADECARSGEPCHYEDSREGRSFDNYVYPIKDGKGSVTRLAILSLDITDRKSFDVRFKEQAALLDIASDAILAKDLEGRVLYWSKGAERLYGWTAEEVVGRTTFELLYPEGRAPEGRDAQRQAIEKGAWRGELHHKTRDGTPIVVEARLTLIRNEAGQPSGILSVKTDITAKRSIEAQLLRSQRLESLGTLAGGIAHDLNNVLAPILMGIEGLSLRDADDSLRGILSIIKASAQRGANIVRQILNFARGMEGDHGEIQLKHVFREVVDIIRETFPKSISVTTDIPKDLWPANGDATQLHQVLMNLCVNARDAMPDGGVLAISAQNARLDEAYASMNIEARPIRYVALKVEDTGKGMPPDVQERIFDPFFTTKEPGKGTGLGLSTVRSIVKSHGGFVTVYSEPNKGSSFKVYVPAAEQGAESGERGPDEGIPMGKGEAILIVDDEASMRDISRQILESYGYQVITAADGTEAVAKFAQGKDEIRLVVTDMMMPYMDGAATIRAIHRIDPGARFIATSGLTAGENEKEARDLGVEAFLAKPYTAERLLHALRDVLDRDGGGAARE
jgi:PAS domain S-box-containing protein